MTSVKLGVPRDQSGWSRASRVAALHSVAETANGFDEIASLSELGTQPLNVHVDRSSLDVGRGLPNVFQKVCTTLHPAASLCQYQEQLVLGRREVDQASVDRNAMFFAVDRD